MSKPDITTDMRVIAMANCMIFAVAKFRNMPVIPHDGGQMETWHKWFVRTLKEAGYEMDGKTALDCIESLQAKLKETVAKKIAEKERKKS